MTILRPRLWNVMSFGQWCWFYWLGELDNFYALFVLHINPKFGSCFTTILHCHFLTVEFWTILLENGMGCSRSLLTGWLNATTLQIYCFIVIIYIYILVLTANISSHFTKFCTVIIEFEICECDDIVNVLLWFVENVFVTLCSAALLFDWFALYSWLHVF